VRHKFLQFIRISYIPSLSQLLIVTHTWSDSILCAIVMFIYTKTRKHVDSNTEADYT